MKLACIAFAAFVAIAPTARADDPKPIAVVEPADAQELSRILQHETPPAWGAPIAAWFNALAARQQAREKAAEPKKEETK